MDFNNELINAFSHAIGPGRDALSRAALSLLSIIAAIDLTLAALFWAISGENFLPQFLRKILSLGFFLWVVKNFERIMAALMDGFIEVATLTSGRSVSGLIKDPAGIMAEGFRVIDPIMNYLGGFGMLDIGADMLFAILTLVITMLAFAVLALTVTVTWIEYFLLTTLALIFIPFGAFRHTAFMAEKAFALAISFGVKIMVMATVIGLSSPLLFTLPVPEAPSLFDMGYVMLASLTVAVLAVHAPGLAAGILAGSPSLSSGSVLGSAPAVAAGVAATQMASAARSAAPSVALRAAGVTAGVLGKVSGTSGGVKDALSSGGVAAGGKALAKGATRSVSQGVGACAGGVKSSFSASRAGEISADLQQRFSASRERVKNPYPVVPIEKAQNDAIKRGANSYPSYSGKKRGGASVRRVMGALKQTARPDGGLSVPIK